MNQTIDISELWSVLPEYKLLDVRTPAEYEKGHIPQAGSLPLFTNEERSIVGTIYKQESPDLALKKGLGLVGPKMTAFVEEASLFATDKKLVLYCWRGGKRSSSMAWLLDIAGFDVKVIRGGYKAYRNFILDQFKQVALPLVVLGGRTGCGKTQLIAALEKAGEQTIDLEGLARHKGSAFGALGEAPQPSVEFFENRLYDITRNFDKERIIWVENESRSIGSIYIPQGFWDQMKVAPLINVEVSFEKRLQILVEQYAKYPKEGLRIAFERIKKRLGGMNYKSAIEAVNQNDFGKAAALALAYYDKSYQYMLDNNQATNIYHLDIDEYEPEQSADKLVEFYTKKIQVST